MRRIGILGGTFDPPHVGHLILAQHALEALDLDVVLFVPAGDPPHKRDAYKTPVDHRVAMLALAIGPNPGFSLSRVDVDRPGPHYSVDMVRLIGEQHPDADLYFVMGGDSLRDLPRWYQPETLIGLCQLAVMRRPGDTLDAVIDRLDEVVPELAARVTLLEGPMMFIASSAIETRLRHGFSVRYIVPDSVLTYIHEHNLYED